MADFFAFPLLNVATMFLREFHLGKSKKYRGKLCVYCRQNMSTTVDHVFPREMFQLDQRSLLPKVPSCTDCNNEKSKLEHYLLAILPFGATHSNAHKALSIDVSKRLNKNRKLHKKIKMGFDYRYIPSVNHDPEKRITVSLELNLLYGFIGFVGRGLMWHHWKKCLPLNCSFKIFTPSSSGIDFLSYLFQSSTKYRVDRCLGDDTVRYKGVMSEKDEGVIVWAIQLFGGLTLFDEALGYVFSNSFIAMISWLSDTLEKLELK